ncbi:LOW QUALITY PROTEIN: hypothetical protein Cgig2_024288 [Carnegiea gigantea]|uniref:Uncharacterized protein n=1 Tax=Carnegiea gigantea TaxID=171969 RepID=A0A9Q1GW38_9CARY|nr:LOW QUALITY PROTEIN: hypothetical protein Cgig2_024288 [Carnegiea gigantea]
MLGFILAKQDRGERFERNFIINLVSCFFGRPKNCYCGKSIFKYIEDVNQIAFLDCYQFILDKMITSVRRYKESKATKGVHFDAPYFHFINKIVNIKFREPHELCHVIVEKEDHCEDVVRDQPNNFMKKDDSIPSYSLGLGLSQPDSQSPIPQPTSMPDPNTAGVNEDDGSEDHDDGAPLRFPLRTLLN